MKKIPYLDGWRGLAIVSVLAAHFGPVPLRWAGLFGVLLFFVLSGVFMAQLLFIRKIDLPTFFVRRFSRVMPTFILFVLCMLVYGAFFQPTPYIPAASELFYTLTFLRSYLPPDSNIWSAKWVISHIWSLNVEEHSYIALACIALLTSRIRDRNVLPLALGASTITLLALNIHYLRHPLPVGDAYASNWHIQTHFVALGLVASSTFRVIKSVYSHSILTRAHWALTLIVLGVAVFCGKYYSYRGLHITVVPLCLAYVVNHLDTMPDLFKKGLAFPLLGWFGRCSFSIYLWQQPYFLLVERNGASPSVYLAFAIATGAASYYLFENPVRIFLNRCWDKRIRSRSPVAVSSTTVAP
ncbi:MAG: acyltransferase [Cytophagaceae bacterium]|nr:MAG: acyltransferase [Cytophagaceae bacterium]